MHGQCPLLRMNHGVFNSELEVLAVVENLGHHDLGVLLHEGVISANKVIIVFLKPFKLDRASVFWIVLVDEVFCLSCSFVNDET